MAGSELNPLVRLFSPVNSLRPPNVTSETSFTTAEGETRELLSVYVPMNHIYVGDVVLVPKEHVIHTQFPVQDGIQHVLSAGATLPRAFTSAGRRGGNHGNE